MSSTPTAPRSPLIRWTPSLARLPASAVRLPLVWLIVNGVKDIENRSRRTRLRGRLLIHASSNLRGCAEKIELVERKHGISVPSELDTGGIIGIVDVIDCVESHRSKRFENGGFGWVVANSRRLKFRRCKGAVRPFRPKFEG